MSVAQRIPRPLVALPKPTPAGDITRNNPGVKPVQRDGALRLVTGEPDAATLIGWAKACGCSIQAATGAWPKRTRGSRVFTVGVTLWVAVVIGIVAASLVLNAQQPDTAAMRIEAIR